MNRQRGSSPDTPRDEHPPYFTSSPRVATLPLKNLANINGNAATPRNAAQSRQARLMTTSSSAAKRYDKVSLAEPAQSVCWNPKSQIVMLFFYLLEKTLSPSFKNIHNSWFKIWISIARSGVFMFCICALWQKRNHSLWRWWVDFVYILVKFRAFATVLHSRLRRVLYPSLTKTRHRQFSERCSRKSIMCMDAKCRPYSGTKFEGA